MAKPWLGGNAVAWLSVIYLAKVGVQTVLGWLPGSHHTNYWMQRYVSRRLPRQPDDFDAHVLASVPHAEAWRSHGPSRSLSAASVYEFGAGYDLIGAVSMWALGAERQLLLDIRRNLRLEQVRHSVQQLRERRTRLESQIDWSLREPPDFSTARLTEILRALGIDYQAPADARKVNVFAGSKDFITSTYTLEHIPPVDLVTILQESRRLLRSDGIISARIDLKDHYAYIDASIGAYDFLRHSESTWRFLNPPLHYLNRLRWPEYLRIFALAGLEVIHVELVRGSTDDLARLQQLRLPARFKQYSLEDLAIREANVVLRSRLV